MPERSVPGRTDSERTASEHLESHFAATAPASPASEIDSHSTTTEPKVAAEAVEDWTWTVMLFAAGHDWVAVMAIRRMTDIELAGSLVNAIQSGGRIDRSWLIAPDGGTDRTVGQQRVHREVQRRSAAGVS